MKKSNLSVLLLISLIMSLFSCKNLPITISKKAEPVNLTYYSITTAKAYHEENYYMDLDVKIPKITYSTEGSDELFDTINNEIDTKLSSLISDAKDNALLTYKTYLNTAKNNVQNDKEAKIENLKRKYKNILGSDEVKAINEVLNMEISTSSVINGFTNSENLIIPELHNKNIIVIETTASKEINQTTVSISGNPGESQITPPEDTFFYDNINRASRSNIKGFDNRGNFDNRNNFDNRGDFDNRGNFENRKNRSTHSDMRNTSDFNDKNNSNNNKKINIENAKESIKEVDTKNENNSFLNTEEIVATKSTVNASDSNIKKELTLDDFYDELNRIKMIIIPNDYILTRAYTPSKITCNFDVKCLDEDYMSLYVELSETKTVTNTKRLFYNIDLKNKKIITISDILGNDFKEKCIKSISNAIENFDEEQKSKLKSDYNIETLINDDIDFFVNNNHIPVVVIDKFAISPGHIEFQIIE